MALDVLDGEAMGDPEVAGVIRTEGDGLEVATLLGVLDKNTPATMSNNTTIPDAIRDWGFIKLYLS